MSEANHSSGATVLARFVKVPFFVSADQGFGKEPGLALRFEEPSCRVLVMFVDGSRSWCDRWEATSHALHPATVADLAEAFVEMIPAGEVDALKRKAIAAIRSIKGWFD
jgi:hypothetical protein